MSFSVCAMLKSPARMTGDFLVARSFAKGRKCFIHASLCVCFSGPDEPDGR